MTRGLWLELLGVTLLAAVLAASVPLHAGVWSWSWDALNHHVYLGYIAEAPRWHLDVAAASTQSYQYPYLYWPVYRLSLWTAGGPAAGAVWGALLAALLMPPIWWASRHLLPPRGSAVQAAFERLSACALASSSGMVIAAIGTTANDPLSVVPLLWAVAIMCAPVASDQRASLAAALWGASVAFKFSNALALPLLLAWWWVPQRPWLPWRRGVRMAGAATLAFIVAYAPWGWQLWLFTGNPVYPFLGHRLSD